MVVYFVMMVIDVVS